MLLVPQTGSQLVHGRTNVCNITSPAPTLRTFSAEISIAPLRAQFLSPFNEGGKGGYPELFKSTDSTQPAPVLCLQVRAYDSQCSNWCDHNYDQLKGKFPGYLPIAFFIGKKEGDVVQIECKEKGECFEFKCVQLASCFNHDGHNFEYAIENMFMVAYNDYSDRYLAGLLNYSETEEWNIIKNLKNQYYPNSTITNRGMSTATDDTRHKVASFVNSTMQNIQNVFT